VDPSGGSKRGDDSPLMSLRHGVKGNPRLGSQRNFDLATAFDALESNPAIADVLRTTSARRDTASRANSMTSLCWLLSGQ
jgi:hypothetical protein